MMVRWSLQRKILLLALLNLVLLGGLLLAIARSQFGIGAESVLLGPVHDRLLAVGNAFGLEYENTPPEARDALVASYSSRYGVDVFLSNPRGEWLAGPQVELPVELLEEMRRREERKALRHPRGKRDRPPAAASRTGLRRERARRRAHYPTTASPATTSPMDRGRICPTSRGFW